MARRATFLNALRANGRELLLLDGGDCFYPSTRMGKARAARAQATRKARTITAAYNSMGYAALAVADTDLALGIDGLKGLEKEARFPFLLANLVDARTGAPLFRRSHIARAGGVRVGIFAVLMNTIRQAYLDRVAPGTKLLDAVETARAVAAELEPRVDLIVALSHVNEPTTRRILAEVPSVRIAVDPHAIRGNHTIWLPEEDFFRWQGDKVILGCDGQGARLGVLEVAFRAREAPWRELPEEEPEAMLAAANGVRFQIAPIEPQYADAPEIAALVEAFRRSTRTPSIDREAVAQAARGRYLTAERCRGCHEDAYRAWRATAHGRAYATLARTGDEYRYDCLPCHTLGYGETFLDAHRAGPYRDVQCESCHGTSPGHPDAPSTHRFGPIKVDACLRCHNPQKLGTPFRFAERVAAIRCPKGGRR